MVGKLNLSLGLDELKSNRYHLIQAMLAECLGTFILCFFGVGSCAQEEDGTFKALAFGLGVFIAITVVGHVSGGHINPAVSVGMLVAGKISLIRCLLYIPFQCLGALGGTCFIRVLINGNYNHDAGHTLLGKGIDPLQGFGIEFCLGLVLVLTVLGSLDPLKPDSHYTAALAIGLAITLGHLGTIQYTGSSMNPARSLSTAILNGSYEDHWVYWAGPILGGVAAAIIYILLLDLSEPSHEGLN